MLEQLKIKQDDAAAAGHRAFHKFHLSSWVLMMLMMLMVLMMLIRVWYEKYEN